MKDKFKFVIAGFGNIASTYISAIKKIDNADVVGVISRTGHENSTSNLKDKIEFEKSLKKLKTNFDAVIICTPNGLHHTLAIKAASMGKHVLTEKPIDISLRSIDKMIDICKKNNVKLGVAYQRRMNPDNIVMKKIISENKLGRIFAADLTVKNYRPDSYYYNAPYRGTWALNGGGPFMMQASHNIDLYLWFFGKPNKIVSDYDTFIHKIEVEDHGAALLRYKNGMIGTIIASTAAKPGFDPKLEIHSEAGTVVMENDIITLWAVEGIENPSQAKGKKVFSGASSAVVSDTSSHEAIIKDFIQAVKENREPVVSAEAARLTTEIILKIYKSKIK